MSNIIKKWKLIFCVGLFSISIVFSIIVFIKKPMKVEQNYIYNTAITSKKVKINFPIIQHVKITKDKLDSFIIYLQDESINKYKYNLKITDVNNNIYYDTLYENYNSNIILAKFNMINNSKNMDFNIEITCPDCEDIYLLVNKPINNNDTILDTNNCLQIIYSTYTTNNSYYWYSIVGITISLILYPLAKEESNEKK